MICLVDGNNFFVSCERVFNASLRNAPVVVLSSNDGCIISRSNEAKALGIKMGQPIFQIQALIEKHNVQVFSSNFELYGDMSERMMSVIAECAPNSEVYSIDEAFCDLSFVPISMLTEYGKDIKHKVYKYTGLPCGIGISYTKVLAKIANAIAKKSKKANGVLALTQDKHIDYALSITKVEDVWGIGRRYANLLYKNGIFTAQQFRDMDVKWVQKHLSIVGVRIQEELQKKSCLELELLAKPKKSITVSRSFGTTLKEYDELVPALSHFVCSAARQLRAQKSETDRIGVILATNRFYNKNARYQNFHVVRLSHYTSSNIDLMKAALECLQVIYKRGFAYQKCGVYLSHLKQESDLPSHLFDTRSIEKDRNLYKTLDAIKDKYGYGALSFANALDYSWKPKSLKKSKEYSTNLDEIMSVK